MLSNSRCAWHFNDRFWTVLDLLELWVQLLASFVPVQLRECLLHEPLPSRTQHNRENSHSSSNWRATLAASFLMILLLCSAKADCLFTLHSVD